MGTIPLPEPTPLSAEDAARLLVGHHHLGAPRFPDGARGVRKLLETLRCIQLDPLDVVGTNADLVALARIDGIARGDVYRHLYPGHAFEHFAKERCLLPASAFPWYRTRAAETPWWRLRERLERISEALLAEVLEEVRRTGPVTADRLTNRGAVKPLDWNGWKGTARATAMALEVLWTRCEVVVCGRENGRKVYDVPERALPKHAATARGDFERWALVERVHAAGLLSRAGGPQWSMLSDARTSELPDALVADGVLEEVRLPGSARRYLAPRGFLGRRHPKPDGRMRLLGPLDPLLWDRGLVRQAFGFDYVWEVYKPASLRRWGWYVCPLLQGNALVGRIEARVEKTTLVVAKIWREKHAPLDGEALDACLDRHAKACGATRVTRPKRVIVG